MITIEQAKVIGKVLKRFNDSEVLDWTDVDEYMEYLSWLSDKQLIIESGVLLAQHKESNARCDLNHPPEECFIPVVLDAVSYILDDYKNSSRLANKARYVLEYYLSFSQVGSIIVD